MPRSSKAPSGLWRLAPLVLFVALSSCRSPGKPRKGQPSAAPPAPALPSGAPPAHAPRPAVSAAAPRRADSIVILAGGDVSLGRGAGQQILKDPSYDPFTDVAPLMATADLRFVNLESQLSDQHGETQSPFQHLKFTGPPGGAEVLAHAGIDVVSIANNHCWDYGKKALFETMDNLDRAGVRYAGASRVPEQQYKPVILHVKGWKIALFAVTQIWNQPPFDKHEGRFYVAWAHFDRLEKALARARRDNDLVLVSYHGGGEYVDVPMQWTRDFVKAVMNAGADAVIGHHPHVPLGVGWFDGRPAFYSLGNLVFAMHRDYPWTGTSFFARLRFSRDGRREVEACPYHILGHTPMLFEGKTKAARERVFRHHLEQLSAATGGTTVGSPGRFSCMRLSPRPKETGPARAALAHKDAVR